MLAAVLLCAGKGTRMNDNSINKVCFPCAGVPVIKRIINNLRAGGIGTFVVVVGHQAQSVMEALGDEPGVIYAYQKEQKGTGHATLCGLMALKNAGYHGRVIVTMGDKIISPHVIRELLDSDQNRKAIVGVQPLANNYNGGRVVVEGKKAYGIVEFADAALMAVAPLAEEKRAAALKKIGINEKKAVKVLAKAKKGNVPTEVTIGGKSFTAKEILSTPYANAALYCFDVDAVVDAISKCTTANAQGELYLTDTISMFAEEDQVRIYEVAAKEDMRTFSTKPELQAMSSTFYRTATEFLCAITAGDLDNEFAKLYNNVEYEKNRYADLISIFKEKYGDRKMVITRSPGRINLLGRHIDHRGGSVNVAAINRDVVMAVSPRADDVVNVSFADGAYPDCSFSISGLLGLTPHRNWLDYLEAEPVKQALKDSNGEALNYVKSAILRLQLEVDVPLCGMDIALTGSVPMAVGLSSSSAIVVATAEAVCFLNNLTIAQQAFVELCGEGEWFVGSRGGAADHAAMKCSTRGYLTHLSFKPFTIGEAVPFSPEYAILVANSMQRARKSEGAKDQFNAKVAASDVALMLLKKQYPQYNFKEFRDITTPDQREIYNMMLSLPCKMTRHEILKALPKHTSDLERIFSNHADPGFYDVRGVALYGVCECLRAEKCVDTLNNGDYALLGKMMRISHQGDSVTDTIAIDDASICKLRDSETPLYLVAGAYECSTERIDGMCKLLDSYDGVLGSSLIGAGLGGCVLALVEADKADNICQQLNRDFYDANGFEHSANVYLASSGSGVMY